MLTPTTTTHNSEMTTVSTETMVIKRSRESRTVVTGATWYEPQMFSYTPLRCSLLSPYEARGRKGCCDRRLDLFEHTGRQQFVDIRERDGQGHLVGV